MAAPKRDLTGFNLQALPAGTQLLFARGGVWTQFNFQVSNPNVTLASPMVFDAYVPSWGTANSPVPWVKAGGTFYAFQFGTYNDGILDGGYTVRNFKVDGLNATDSWGFYLREDLRGVLIENVEITGFHLGVHSTGGGNVGTSLTLRNVNIHHNMGMGFLGEAVQLLIEDSTFTGNNFSGSIFNHAIYLGGHGRNATIRNNTFLNNSTVNGVCRGGNLTVHGQWDGLLIEGNTIQQDESVSGCWGVSVNPGYDTAEYFRNVVIRNNRVINLGGCAMCITSAPGVVVENNLIVNTRATSQSGIIIGAPNVGSGDDASGGSIVRNNTIYFAGNAGSLAIGFVNGSGANNQVVSNLIAFGPGTSNGSCFLNTGLANFTAFDNNLCHNVGSNPTWSGSFATLAAARIGGFDAAGMAADPQFVSAPSAANSWNDAIQTGSPARGAGHATRSSATDRLGVARTTPSIGSRQ
ncbi:MAG: hypothetical protein RLZZ618_2787 [Pseudomonadota bacterium]